MQEGERFLPLKKRPGCDKITKVSEGIAEIEKR